MKEKGIRSFLAEHGASEPISFHMPGHKGPDIYRRYGFDDFLDAFMKWDITEIPGADNLFQAEGIIEETAEKYRELYAVIKSFLLINGTSGGIIASILASVPPGKKLVMARNCHKSVFNALSLGNISPVYVYPSIIDKYGISGAVSPEAVAEALDSEPDAEAVILPSPNYYGICSDIRAVAEEVHRRGKVLIADQAHGAHLRFFSRFEDGFLPPSAEESGADIVINSTHKTLASFTQSAVLNVCSDRVDLYAIEDRLQAVESTSPSYLLMASLDINADIIEKHGKELFEAWRENLEFFYKGAKDIPFLSIMDVPGKMDITKINMDMSQIGIKGAQLEEILMDEGIFSELYTGNILMCMTGIGNRRADLERLLNALKKAEGKKTAAAEGGCAGDIEDSGVWTKKRPVKKISGRKALTDIDMCAGLVCASPLIPYPPGIPLVCVGEEISREDIAYVKKLRACGEKVIGIDEKNRISVMK